MTNQDKITELLESYGIYRNRKADKKKTGAYYSETLPADILTLIQEARINELDRIYKQPNMTLSYYKNRVAQLKEGKDDD